MTRRMHNKAWIADCRIAIIGGRNIGDAYFGAANDTNFIDLDLILLGPVVNEAVAMFDQYWNSDAVLPLRALAGELRDRPTLSRYRVELERLRYAEEARPWFEFLLSEMDRLLPKDQKLIWCAKARLVADSPEKALSSIWRKRPQNWLMARLLPDIMNAKRRVAIMSPYFVPGRAGSEYLISLAKRGVDTAVLTNSLAATDVAIVHGGYAPRRVALLRGGVQLYELRRSSRRKRMSIRGRSKASLHTKAFVVDDHLGFVGSLNFDPRSASLNTEMGVLFENTELIEDMIQLFEREISPEVSYRLGLSDTGRVFWHHGDGNFLYRDPDSGLARRTIALIASWLPIEAQL